MRILVTGASGFLGSHLVPKLKSAGHTVIQPSSRQADLTAQGSLEKLLAGEKGKFDQAYHLAAWTQAGDFCLRHPGEQWIINQQINTNVLSYWHAHQPQAKLIFMGSSCCYDPRFPLKEENFFEGKPIESLFTYGMTKRMLAAGAMALSRQYGHKYVCLVPSTLYGPGYHTDGRQMHFIFDLIRKIMRGKLYGEEVVLWGDGHQRRELVHVDDFVGAALALSEKCENEIVNIGAGEEFEIRHFAALICGKAGFDARKIKYDTTKYVGAKSKCLDAAKMRRLLPGVKMTPLENGLEKTIEWFEKNRATVLKK